MMNVTIEEAYREACTALGESVIRERLLTAELSRSARQAEGTEKTED